MTESKTREVRMLDLMRALAASNIHAWDCPERTQHDVVYEPRLCDCWVNPVQNISLFVNR